MSHSRQQDEQRTKISRAQPLAGVRVLELGRLFAAPFAVQLLADFGAEVIKVERPGRGDEFRHYAPRTVQGEDGRECAESANYLSVNRNKQSITVDIRTAEGQQIIRDLAGRADIVVENYKVGALARYGLDYASLKAVNPDLIYVSVTGFGQSGPYSARPGTDAVFQAMSGLMSLTGEPDGSPQRVGIVISDMVAGFYAASSILMALRAREVGAAGGQHIDISLLDSTVAAMAPRALEYFMSGEIPFRLGSRAKGSAPSQIYRCSNGLLQMQATTEPDFARLCAAMELDELVGDPRFTSRMQRYANVDALTDLLEAKFGTDTVEHWYNYLLGAGVMCAPVYTVDQTFADPHIRERGLHREVERIGTAAIPTISNPIRFDGVPLDGYRAPPLLGQHTDAVLGDLLGRSPGDIQTLKDKGII